MISGKISRHFHKKSYRDFAFYQRIKVMSEDKHSTDIFLIILIWLIAIAVLYLFIIKLKFLSHL